MNRLAGVGVILVFFLSVDVSAQEQDTFILTGTIQDSKGHALTNATIRTEDNRFAVTDTNGYYELQMPRKQLRSSLWIEVRYVGKSTYQKELIIPEGTPTYRHDVMLENLDLYLDDVTVSAGRSGENVSNSAYVIDRVAIEQSQAYTLGDLLQLIPGQSVTNPQLQGAQTINFRADLPVTTNRFNQFNLNNAFGIGIFLNGQSLNNNTNMQGLNPVTNGRFRSFGKENIDGNEFTGSDTPGGGFDLRSLPVGNIERVEVVQGIASAQYGDILEGGIFIETAAGHSSWNASLRRSGGEVNIGINKGFQLHPRHALNVSADYLYSNANPRDRIKAYNRLSASALWTSYFRERRDIENTVSITYGANLDDFKTDPDLGNIKKVYYQNKRLSFSNRLKVQSQQLLFDNFTVLLSANIGSSTSHIKHFVNPGVSPVTDVTKEGIFEGTYHPSSYWTERKVLGKPISLDTKLRFNRIAQLGEWDFNISYGGSVNFDANYGKGRVFDPLRPINEAGAIDSERPVSYKELRPEVWQGAAWLESTITGNINGYKLVSSIGLRGDLQHGYKTLSPRLNTKFYLTDTFALTGAYGIHVKAPGLIHLYPGPDYEDFTLLNSYNGKLKESIYLAYTKLTTDVLKDLHPMRSYRAELGFQWEMNAVDITTTFYRNVSDNGFALERVPEYLELPVYEIVDRSPGEKPEIEDTGETQRAIYEQGYLKNATYTRNWGIEITANTLKIDAIQTSFALNLSYTNSYYFSRTRDFNLRHHQDPQPGQEIWYGIYPHDKTQRGRAHALLTSMHHISELGLLLTIRSEAFLYNYEQILANSNRATAYVNNELEVIPIAEDEMDDPRFDVLDRAPMDGIFRRSPRFVYFNFHANVSKNISRAVRLSFFANNFLNIRPEVINSEGTRIRTLNQEPYFGMELRLTL